MEAIEERMKLMQVTFKGKPIEVSGVQPKVGDKAPGAALLNNQGETVQLTTLFDKLTVLSVVPDVNTQTCNLQTRKFAELSKDKTDWQYFTVSRNTVDEFNQWNHDNDLEAATLSDFNQEFGKAYGLDIHFNDKDLLARAVFIVDQEGIIRYSQIVEEISEQPKYDEVMQAIEDLK